MVLHNPNNWHWVNKDVAPWTREYLEKHLVGLAVEEAGVSASIAKVLSMDGDVDVSQRKGKVITLFDVKLQLEYAGTSSPREGEMVVLMEKAGATADGKDVSGTITIPEVAHDTAEDEYVFDIDVYSDESSKKSVKELVRGDMVPRIRKELHQLGPAIIAEHGKDLQHPSGSGPSGGVTAPAPSSTTTSNAPGSKDATAPAATASSDGKGSSVNVSTVTDTEEFRTTAEELYQTFTDADRITAFTRSAPKVFEGAKKGGKFELFGGNVAGEFIDLRQPTLIVQRWRLNQWPAGHFSTLEIKFDQNDRDAVTVMRVNWKGVPKGQEEVTKRNWQEYYVRSIKTTFGFGTVL
ncbi:MAG: hypothetical protein M1826_005630 [Phylliscum demangeonii]|nr:MAG: hypothetical protein M1826_005630 [Phylliscum demangeonii]